MSWYKFSPVILTLLVFLLAQGLSIILIFGIGMQISPEFSIAFQAFLSGTSQDLPLFELLPISLFSLMLMAINIFAVLCCHFTMHNIQFSTTFDFSSIRWRLGMLALAGGFLGALSISILTESMELPDLMMQTSLEMSHNIWGLITIVIVGPVTEELLFREAIEGEMLRRGTNPWIAIIVSALAFSAMHLNPAQCLYAFPLGIIFAIIYYKTGNIVITSLLHILNNGIVAAQLYTLDEDMADISYSEWLGGDLKAYTAMLILGLLCIVLMRLFWNFYLPFAKNDEKTIIRN